MTEPSGRVLVVGVSAQTNARVVAELDALGLEVTGCTEPHLAATSHDATAFDVIAFGRATLGATADEQKAAFRRQNPAIRFVDAIGPLAVRMVLGALAHDPATPRFVATLDVEPTATRGILRADVLAPCTLRLWLFRMTGGALTSETLALVQAEPSIFTLSVRPDQMQDAYSFVAEADDEFAHFAVLDETERRRQSRS